MNSIHPTLVVTRTPCSATTLKSGHFFARTGCHWVMAASFPIRTRETEALSRIEAELGDFEELLVLTKFLQSVGGKVH